MNPPSIPFTYSPCRGSAAIENLGRPHHPYCFKRIGPSLRQQLHSKRRESPCTRSPLRISSSPAAESKRKSWVNSRRNTAKSQWCCGKLEIKASSPKTLRINPKAAYYRLRIGPSPLHRYGVFALEDIPRGRRVIEYTGKRLTYERAYKVRPPMDVYLAGMNSRWCVDGSSGGSGAQFINHSCEPNLVWLNVRDRLFFFSRRKIRTGEELTVSYRYPIKLKRIPCRCGARRCRGTLRFVLS